MKFCLFLALLVRVTHSLGGEKEDEKVVEAKSQDVVVAQLVVRSPDPLGNLTRQPDIWQNKSKDILVGRRDIWQNKSTHLLDEEHQISVKGEKMPTLNCSILR